MYSSIAIYSIVPIRICVTLAIHYVQKCSCCSEHDWNYCVCSCRSPVATTAAISKHQLEKQAFQKCSVIITDQLDISEILPHLISHGLLTDKDRQTLLNKVLTSVEKTHYLLDVLPRKDSGFFETFIFCLCQSKNGTGHGDIVKALTASFKEVKESNCNILH